MAHRYQIEHVSTLRGGEKVRTVTRKGHRVRIAFPRGQRKKGSGRVIEVLHPLHENPCRLPNPAELVVMMANPSTLGNPWHASGNFRTREEAMERKRQLEQSGQKVRLVVSAKGTSAENYSVYTRNPSSSDASHLYEEFHGESAEHVDEYQEPSPRPATLTELGDLIELQIKRPTGWKWAVFNFTGRNVKLASNAAGTQLYFISGNQKVTRGELTHAGADNSKELIDLGEAMMIAYRAKKAQVDGIAANYEHRFGEETGVRPRLMYDTRGPSPRLYLSGGEYRVEAAGIIN